MQVGTRLEHNEPVLDFCSTASEAHASFLVMKIENSLLGNVVNIGGQRKGHSSHGSTTANMFQGSYSYATSTFSSKALVYGTRLIKALHEWHDEYVIMTGVIVASGEMKPEEKHSKVKSKRCRFCGKLFTDDEEYKCHLTTHFGDYPHQCTTCKRHFRERANLRAHMRTHTGEKPYLCSVCGNRFREKTAFSRHRLTHTEQKPYKCTLCEKSFKQSAHLRSHELVHSGEKPYICVECGKGFSQSGKLRRHHLVHTRVKAFHCEVCQKRFSLNGDLTVHRRMQHKVTK